ncbi:hypothetical protein [Enterobacter hormaechei]|uniref:hypothetical protein n=1 Tax=Enterobacter hormaechei TaxID=158836 RepID=UPI002E288F43|nr:hypothetical protein [Enterobacter hormaechei]MED5715802.1 hypothetical protein [Enterobacter hormaechei]
MADIIDTAAEIEELQRNAALSAQGRINTASIDRFNNDFEHLDHREAAQIRAELETSEHIKSLRAQRAA